MVLFPAPLGPISATFSPGSIVNDTFSSVGMASLSVRSLMFVVITHAIKLQAEGLDWCDHSGRLGPANPDGHG